MSNNHYFEDVVKKARGEVWEIINDLLAKKVDIDTILCILKIQRKDLEEVQEAKKNEAKHIAISLAKDAHELKLTAKTIEEKTGVNKSEFIRYISKE